MSNVTITYLISSAFHRQHMTVQIITCTDRPLRNTEPDGRRRCHCLQLHMYQEAHEMLHALSSTHSSPSQPNSHTRTDTASTNIIPQSILSLMHG